MINDLKVKRLTLRWYSEAKLESLASVSKSLANAEDHNKIVDDHNEKEMHTNDEQGFTDTDRNLSLEALKSQLQALCKKVKENESALKMLN